jgi:SWI/SNF-related matrix-associated actin-dependent regulator 1 of chromatin subfamily A
MTLKTKLFGYQEKGVRRMFKFGMRSLLADEMGLGKSISALALYDLHIKEGTVLIICPAFLKWNWQNEIRQHLGQGSVVLEGRTPPQDFAFPKVKFVIVNYDILGNLGGRKRTWAKLLRKHGIRYAIVDECQAIRNREAKRTKQVHALLTPKKVPYIAALSGTPLVNRPSELWSVLNLVRPDLYDSFFSYAMKHCSPEKTFWGWQYKGAEKMDELHLDLMSTMMVRRLKVDVLHELPDKTRTVLPLEIENRKEYTRAVEEFIVWLKSVGRFNSSTVKAEKLVKMGYLKRLAAELKLKYVLEWIADFLQASDEKLIVFGIHKKILRAIRDRFPNVSVLVDGSVIGRKRQVAVDQFCKDTDTRLFIGNVHAAGSGWNGTVSRTVAFAEIDWSPGTHKQAEDRVHRIGQKSAAQAVYLVAKDTIEVQLLEVIQKKQLVSDEVLNGGVDRDDTLDVYSQLENILLAKGRK